MRHWVSIVFARVTLTLWFYFIIYFTWALALDRSVHYISMGLRAPSTTLMMSQTLNETKKPKRNYAQVLAVNRILTDEIRNMRDTCLRLIHCYSAYGFFEMILIILFYGINARRSKRSIHTEERDAFLADEPFRPIDAQLRKNSMQMCRNVFGIWVTGQSNDNVSMSSRIPKNSIICVSHQRLRSLFVRRVLAACCCCCYVHVCRFCGNLLTFSIWIQFVPHTIFRRFFRTNSIWMSVLLTLCFVSFRLMYVTSVYIHFVSFENRAKLAYNPNWIRLYKQRFHKWKRERECEREREKTQSQSASQQQKRSAHLRLCLLRSFAFWLIKYTTKSTVLWGARANRVKQEPLITTTTSTSTKKRRTRSFVLTTLATTEQTKTAIVNMSKKDSSKHKPNSPERVRISLCDRMNVFLLRTN